jgi:hypothetical protein
VRSARRSGCSVGSRARIGWTRERRGSGRKWRVGREGKVEAGRAEERAIIAVFGFLENRASRSLFPLEISGFQIVFVIQNIRYFVILDVGISSYFVSFPISFIEYSCKGLPALFISLIINFFLFQLKRKLY